VYQDLFANFDVRMLCFTQRHKTSKFLCPVSTPVIPWFQEDPLSSVKMHTSRGQHTSAKQASTGHPLRIVMVICLDYSFRTLDTFILDYLCVQHCELVTMVQWACYTLSTQFTGFTVDDDGDRLYTICYLFVFLHCTDSLATRCQSTMLITHPHRQSPWWCEQYLILPEDNIFIYN